MYHKQYCVKTSMEESENTPEYSTNCDVQILS